MSDVHPAGGTSGHFDDDLDLLDSLLGEEGIGSGAERAIPRRARDVAVPMSFAQELLWMLDRASPGLTAYHLPTARRLRGRLDLAALERALSLLVERHESLRTRFTEVDGEPRLIIDPPGAVSASVVDLSALPVEERESEAERIARDRARMPFDLGREHLFRVSLIRLADEDHILLIDSHHIVLDGWSMGVLFRELAEAYAAQREGRTPALATQAIDFGDFALWQRERLSGDHLARLLEFWRGQLGEATEPLALPTDRPRSATPAFTGARRSLQLDAADSARIRSLAQRHDATLYMALLAGYGCVLHRYTGRDNVLIGSGSAGRTLPETEALVGYLNNTIVQRADCSGDPTFAELLGRVRESALAAYDHQEVPLEKLVLELRRGAERLSPAPLFEVVLTMQDAMSAPFTLAGLEASPYGLSMAGTKFDLTLLVAEQSEGLLLTAQYRSDLFEPATVDRFLGHLRTLLVAAASDPSCRLSALPLLSEAERAALDTWNATAVDEGERTTLTELVASQVARVPERAAVIAEDATLTYAQLAARAREVARRLTAAGVSPRDRVGLLLDRSAEAIVGLLGILEAGAAFVPLSVDAPDARIARQLAECGATALVASKALAARWATELAVVQVPDADIDVGAADAEPTHRASPDDLAYVLYTSGSTGVPKGVAVTHAHAVHYARAVSRVLADFRPDEPGDGFATLDGLQIGMVSTLAADLGYTSLLVALLAGGTLRIFSKEASTEPARFADLVAAHPLDILKITPGHLHALIGSRRGRDLVPLVPRRWLVLGGEPLRPELARLLLDAGTCRVLNHYGPTETTVGACTLEVNAARIEWAAAHGAQTVPIGRPLANVQALVTDGQGTELPVGVPGELMLGGAGVAAGYLGRPDLTAERFVERNGQRQYRTGDRARRLPDGTVEFLGR
ncbi:MAG TPA: condensation domain-containing protein, partial [Gemmatimonadaceae bacterium]